MGRKLFVWGMLPLVGIALVLFLFRGPLSMRIVRVGVARNLSADLSVELPVGLHVLLCGAGGPLPDPARSGPCTAVIAGDSVFVFDAGMGGARNLGRMGLPPGQVDAVFLTHFHSDHIDGLGELQLLRWVPVGHSEPLPVYGTAGVSDVVDGFNLAYRQDARFRSAHHGTTVAPASGAGMAARPFETPSVGHERVVWEQDGVRIAAFQVDHSPVHPAVGYRIDFGGRSVVISGDTSQSTELERVAKGVDLLVHEALAARIVAALNEVATSQGRENLARITADIPDYHTTPVEAAESAERAGARRLLFYHVVPPLVVPGMEAVFLDGVSEAYSGGVTVGRDGTLVSLPSGSKAIEISSR